MNRKHVVSGHLLKRLMLPSHEIAVALKTDDNDIVMTTTKTAFNLNPSRGQCLICLIRSISSLIQDQIIASLLPLQQEEGGREDIVCMLMSEQDKLT